MWRTQQPLDSLGFVKAFIDTKADVGRKFEIHPPGDFPAKVAFVAVERGANVRLIRDNVVIHEGKLSQLKRFKDDAREVVAGQECGMSFENYQDMKVGDVIECYRVETVQRTL